MEICILFIDSNPYIQPSEERILSHPPKNELLRDSKQLAQNHRLADAVVRV